MSLCRWSSMDWQCDLYVYGGEGGWVVHVASNRIDADIPSLDWTTAETYVETHRAAMAMIDNAPRINIGGPHDGQSFYDMDDEELVETLTMLQGEGYRFPDDLIALVQAGEA